MPAALALAVTAAAAAAIASFSSSSSSSYAADDTYAVTLGAPQLLFDLGGVVSNVSGLQPRQGQPQKMGMVVAGAQHPWEAGLYFYSSVVQAGPADVRLYYGCSGPLNATASFLCVAVSTDGLTFSKPLDLGIVEYNGSSANNIVWATPYGVGGHAGTGWSNGVLFDDRPDVPAAERFKLLYDTDQAPYEGKSWARGSRTAA